MWRGASTPIEIGVGSTFQFHGIAPNVSAYSRIEVAAAVLMQPRMSIEDLSREAQVVGN